MRASAKHLDPFAPEALEDPYPLYARLRATEPVYQIPGTGLLMVTRHADLVEAASRPEDFSSHISAIVYAGHGTRAEVLAADPDAIGAVDVLATQDPPIHTAQRRLLNRSFVHARIAALEPSIAGFVVGAITPGELEWMQQVANPLPLMVISGLLGLPEADTADLKRWGDAGVDLLSGVASPERMAECWGEMVAFLDYLRARLGAPEPGSVTAEVAEAVARGDLDEREGVSVMLQLVIAGSESTTSLLGSAARMLAEDVALQDRLRADPARVALFLEEALRLESPFRGHFRITTRAVELDGVTIPEGARVMLMWGAANRDEQAFPHADALDLAREHPKRHVAFGSGIHSCIGAPLARLEARIAIEHLLSSTARVRLAPGARLHHVPSLFVRRLESLPLVLSR